jgi:hypothetical protein
MKTGVLALCCCLFANLSAAAHDWHPHEDPLFANAGIAGAAEDSNPSQMSMTPKVAASAAVDSIRPLAEAFSRFKPKVRFFWDANFFYVESDGIPDHNMMVGITAWQQQIPLPASYFGANAWRLPLSPIPASSPYLITPTTFTRGAIALAANGIPIFNPYNNRGEASALIGELDQWGGHCGRADDYHYHVSPLHLTNILGNALPLAFALDGYPIFGLVEPDGSGVAGLDQLRGHTNVLGRYHYHSSLTLPYLNAGFHGQVAYINGQVDPQPSVRPVRPAGTPLNGASLVGFTNTAADQFSLRYRLAGSSADYFWNYQLNRSNKSVLVTYITPGGTTQTNYPNWEPAPVLSSTSLQISSLGKSQQILQAYGPPARGLELQFSSNLQEWFPSIYLMMDQSGTTNVLITADSDHIFFRLR